MNSQMRSTGGKKFDILYIFPLSDNNDKVAETIHLANLLYIYDTILQFTQMSHSDLHCERTDWNAPFKPKWKSELAACNIS